MTTMADASIRRTGPRQLAGYSTMAPTVRREKPCTVYFVVDFDRDVAEFGGWEKTPAGKAVRPHVDRVAGPDSGGFARFRFREPGQVLMKVAISYVSEENARRNLEAEVPGWDFDGTVRAAADDWNAWLSTFDGVHQTPPGHHLIATDRHVQVTKYWDFDYPQASLSASGRSSRQRPGPDAAREHVRAERRSSPGGMSGPRGRPQATLPWTTWNSPSNFVSRPTWMPSSGRAMPPRELTRFMQSVSQRSIPVWSGAWRGFESTGYRTDLADQ
jgi:hypothetical protein